MCFCGTLTDLAKSMEDTVRSTAKLLGADGYLSQDPFDAEQFQTAVQSLLDSHMPSNESSKKLGS